MDNIDGIIYINLDYRIDRKEQLLDNLKEYDIDFNKVHRIPGVLNTQCGHIGCAMSHVNAIKYAISKKWNNLLIIEDDFIFTANKSAINSDLERIIKEEFDVLLFDYRNLSINTDREIRGGQCRGGRRQPYKNIKRISSATTTPAYIVKRHYFETLVECFENSIKKMKKQLEKHIEKYSLSQFVPKLHHVSAIDQEWKPLQKKDIFLAFVPAIGTENTYSDNDIDVLLQLDRISEGFPTL
jgi:hypothetical protein